MPDSGRVLYKPVDADNRLTGYCVGGRPVGADEAIGTVAGVLRGAGKLAIVGSGRLSVEEQYLLRRIRDTLGEQIPTWLVARTAEGDGMLLSADRNPNVRGALLTGLINELPEARLEALGRAIDAGEVDTLLAVAEDPLAAGLSVEQLKRVKFIYIGTHYEDCSQYAEVELPLLTVFEKGGTFVNQQFRVQKFSQAVPGPRNVLFGLSTFTRLLSALDTEAAFEPSPMDIWQHMAAEIPEFAGMSYPAIPGTGQLVDASRFCALPFIEGKGLHFEPAAAATANA
jgi:NADH-quinone oxidoreductase subunit G